MNILSWFKPYWKYTDEELVERARKFAGINDRIHKPLLIVLSAAVIAGTVFGWWTISKVTELVQNSKDPFAAGMAAFICGLLGWIVGQLSLLVIGTIYLRPERHHTQVLLRTWERMKELEQVIAATSANQIKSPGAGSPSP
jgi:hypothetical protein